MTFKWETHKPLIKRLYIDEGRTLDEIQEFMKTVHDFTPSRRSWQLHISRWGFKKQHRAEIYDEKLVARVKELWAKNFSHPEILEIVVKEGGGRSIPVISNRSGPSTSFLFASPGHW
uniref:Clr5 domain-containing protein n=1 Tax=Bionectria ochroleuca TaxID=29856 RepID=A0A8H7N7U3_BIOOC